MYAIEEIIDTVICGDCLEVMRRIPDECVDMVCTSPPYWGLRSYQTPPQIWDAVDGCEHEWSNHVRKPQGGRGSKSANVGANKNDIANLRDHDTITNFCLKCSAWRGELGLEPTFQLYLSHLMQIFGEVKRVLKPTGSCWVNISDSYSPSSTHASKTGATMYDGISGDYGKRSGRTVRSEYKRFSDGGVRQKSLCAIPARFQIAMIDAGWICRNMICWFKRNCMPSSASDRFTVDFEPFFFFVKQQKYWFEQQFEESKWGEVWSRKGSGDNTPYEQNNPRKRWGLTKHEIATGRTSGAYCDPLHTKPISANGQRNRRCVWDIPTRASSENHFAAYPDALVETPIKATCPPNGIILDPFCGTGTTCEVAKQLGRRWIGIDLKQEYTESARCNLRNVTPNLL